MYIYIYIYIYIYVILILSEESILAHQSVIYLHTQGLFKKF